MCVLFLRTGTTHTCAWMFVFCGFVCQRSYFKFQARLQKNFFTSFQTRTVLKINISHPEVNSQGRKPVLLHYSDTCVTHQRDAVCVYWGDHTHVIVTEDVNDCTSPSPITTRFKHSDAAIITLSQRSQLIASHSAALITTFSCVWTVWLQTND